MSSLPSGAADRPTSLSVRACRSQIVLDVLLSDPAAVVVVEDVARLRKFATWAPNVLAAAVDDLIDAGLITDDEFGRIFVHAEPAP